MYSIPWQVNLLCLDQTEYFESTLWSTEALLKTYAEIHGSDTVLINQAVMTMDPDEITDAIYSPTDLLHVMSHAESGGTAQGRRKFLKFIPITTVFDPDVLATYAADVEHLPEIECLLLDACESGSAGWTRKLRPLVKPGKKLTLLGTTREVDIDETIVYTMAFYQVLLRQKRPKTASARHRVYLNSHSSASKIFQEIRRNRCPFVHREITGT